MRVLVKESRKKLEADIRGQFVPADLIQWGDFGIFDVKFLRNIFKVLAVTGISVAEVSADNRTVLVQWERGSYKLPRRKDELNVLQWTAVIAEEGQKTMEGNVIGMDELKKRREAKKKKVVTAEVAHSELRCVACSHEVESLEDWNVGVNTAKEEDSGRHVCEKCGSLQPSSMFDGLVQFNPKGTMAGLTCMIPIESIDEMIDTETFGDEKGMRFCLGTAILNAVRTQLIEHYKRDSAVFFPGDKAEIEMSFPKEDAK